MWDDLYAAISFQWFREPCCKSDEGRQKRGSEKPKPGLARAPLA